MKFSTKAHSGLLGSLVLRVVEDGVALKPPYEIPVRSAYVRDIPQLSHGAKQLLSYGVPPSRGSLVE